MGGSLVTQHGAWRLLIAAIVALALVLTLGANSASAASPKACRVKDLGSSKTYSQLQAAVNAARKGARLTVRGTCKGETVIRKNLTILGTRSKRSGLPRLSGDRKSRVLRIEKGAHVTMRGLVITQGKVLVRMKGTSRRTGVGGGILNRGTLVLLDVQVWRNRTGEYGAGDGGGVYNKGRLVLKGSTKITRNSSPGGAVGNLGTLVMNGRSSISGNGGEYLGGIWNTGTVVMNGRSSISNNGGEGPGGVSNSGRFTMNDDSTISRNGSWEGPGGATNWYEGVFTMNDRSSIRGNSGTDGSGGGLANRGGTVTMTGQSSISGNFATYGGGGVSHSNYRGHKATFTMRDTSSIAGNVSEVGGGGGVEIGSGVFRMEGASAVTANTAPPRQEDADSSYNPGDGGGIFVSGGTLVGVTCGAGGNVHGNTPDDCYFAE